MARTGTHTLATSAFLLLALCLLCGASAFSNSLSPSSRPWATPISMNPTPEQLGTIPASFQCPAHCECFNDGGLWINCTVAYFGPHLHGGLLTLLPPKQTLTIIFTCFYNKISRVDRDPESYIWEGAFRELPNLKTLVFDKCVLRNLTRKSFQHLDSLERLIIRQAALTHTDKDLLVSLPKIQDLEISNSRVTSLFSMCPSRSLRILNVTGNHLPSMEKAGLYCSRGDLTTLEVLDLSRNFISEIPLWLGPNLQNLFQLVLAHNSISVSNPEALFYLSKLFILDLTNNSFTAFHHEYFAGCSNVLILKLSQNRVPALASKLVSNLTRLQQLDISDMGLDDQVWLELGKLRQLMQLNVSSNAITSINENIFAQMLRLKVFSARNNKISSVPNFAFAKMYSMRTLDLSLNAITYLPKLGFSDRHTLEEMYLDHNNISTIEVDALAGLAKVKTFGLSHNGLTVLSGPMFSGFQKLQRLDLSFNRLILVDPSTFNNTQFVEHLNISNNYLLLVPNLSYLKKLQVIDMSFNNVSSLHLTTPLELQDITTLIMNNNKLKFIPEKFFQGCDSLTFVNMSHNAISKLESALSTQTPYLRTVDLSYNKIKDIGASFSGLKRLRDLNLSHNKLTQVLKGQFPLSSETINLRDNEIAFISAHTFKSMDNIKSVDLRSNRLETLSKMALEVNYDLAYNPTFYIRYNPFMCDCKLGWLKDWIDGRLEDIVPLPNFAITPGFMCNSPFTKWAVNIQSLDRSQFLCNYTNHCEESCMCCDFDMCYCKYRCPSSCHCFIGDDYMHVHQVECSSAGARSIPVGLPEGATELRVDGNNIQVLHKHAFLALKHVTSLYLNNSQIRAIQNDSFIGLKSLRKLFLNDNYLMSIYSYTFNGLDSLEELYLQNNEITKIGPNALLAPEYLSYVNLQGNTLSSLPLKELDSLINRSLTTGGRPSRLRLGGNPWTCSSSFSCPFLQFILANSDHIEDISFIECFRPVVMYKSGASEYEQDGRLLLELQHDVCVENVTHYNQTQHRFPSQRKESEMYALIATCIIVSFIVILMIICYINRHLLQVLCFTRFGFRMFKMAKAADDSDRPYDAFISYSSKDEDFVVRELAPRLENGDKKFKLCVHYRDFAVGACIAETIVRSVEASKRTILVVSDNFLESEWCRFEFQTAHQQVLSERRNRVILILMHDLNTEKLDNTLKMYMRTRTYLKLDDAWFWEKLMFAMPDVCYRKMEQVQRLPSNRDLEYVARERSLSAHTHPPSRGGSHCGTIHNDMYEIPVLETPSVHYHLAHRCCNSPHTNSAFHNSEGSFTDTTSGYHNGSLVGSSSAHYEEVGPGHFTPGHFSPCHYPCHTMAHGPVITAPPPLPLIPKEGLVPRDKLKTFG